MEPYLVSRVRGAATSVKDAVMGSAADVADSGQQVATTVVPWFNLGAPAPATPTTPAAPATTAPTKSAASTKPATKTTAKPTTGGNR